MSVQQDPDVAAKAWRQGTDPLWSLVAEFGARARAHPAVVEAAILAHLEAVGARQRSAREEAEAAAGDEQGTSAERAQMVGQLYYAKAAASEPPTLEEQLAYLARLHDLVVAEDRDGARRESRRPLAPELDGLLELRWELLLLSEEPELARADMRDKGSHRALEYLAVVRESLPLPTRRRPTAKVPPTAVVNLSVNVAAVASATASAEVQAPLGHEPAPTCTGEGKGKGKRGEYLDELVALVRKNTDEARTTSGEDIQRLIPTGQRQDLRQAVASANRSSRVRHREWIMHTKGDLLSGVEGTGYYMHACESQPCDVCRKS